MFAETAITLMLLLSADGGVAKPKPTASKLSSPKTAVDGGVSLGGNAKAGAALTMAVDGGVADGGIKSATTDAAKSVKPVVKVAMAPDVKALVDRMQAFYEKTADFTASFRQDYHYKAFKRTATSS
ncbi:MAG: hypothetical protein ACJ790_02125, partial [Myxococcaceae bacterium]